MSPDSPRALALPSRPLPAPRARRVRPLSWKRRLADLYRNGELGRRALLAAPLAAIAFAIAAFGGIYGWAYGIAYLLVFAALAAWSIQYFRCRVQLIFRPVFLSGALFAAVALVQLLAHRSLEPAASLTELLHLAAAATVFFLIANLYRRDRDPGWICPALAAFTGAVALLAIAQLLTSSTGVYWTFHYTFATPAGSFVNRNHFAGCMELLLPAAGVEVYRRRRRGWLRVLPWALAPGLGIAALLLSASRGGAAALLVESLVGVAAWFGFRLHRGVPRDPPRHPAANLPATALAASAGVAALPSYRLRRAGDQREPSGNPAADLPAAAVAVGVTALIVILGLVAVVGTSRLQARLAISSLQSASIAQRLDLDRSSLAMWRQRPLLGWGLGAWSDVYPAFARFSDGTFHEFAHNDYLQLLAEMGIAGALAALWFWFLWLRAALAVWRAAARAAPGGAGLPLLNLAAGIACCGLLAHSWVDYNLHIPANLLLFFAMAALAIT